MKKVKCNRCGNNKHVSKGQVTGKDTCDKCRNEIHQIWIEYKYGKFSNETEFYDYRNINYPIEAEYKNLNKSQVMK